MMVLSDVYLRNIGIPGETQYSIVMAILGNAFPFVSPMSKPERWLQAVYYINVPHINDRGHTTHSTQVPCKPLQYCRVQNISTYRPLTWISGIKTPRYINF